jgi:hypothetical protein
LRHAIAADFPTPPIFEGDSKSEAEANFGRRSQTPRPDRQGRARPRRLAGFLTEIGAALKPSRTSVQILVLCGFIKRKLLFIHAWRLVRRNWRG